MDASSCLQDQRPNGGWRDCRAILLLQKFHATTQSIRHDSQVHQSQALEKRQEEENEKRGMLDGAISAR
jgi:hypothetical protein